MRQVRVEYSNILNNASWILTNIRIMRIIQIMWVITCIIQMFYSSNASNYSHYLHDFMWVIIWSIHDICIICIIWNFEYFELNNSTMRVMRGGFESSISAVRVMQVFKLRRGSSHLARHCYASIQISWIFFWYSSMLSK